MLQFNFFLLPPYLCSSVVSTLAGSGNPAFADGVGATAAFNNPRSVAVDASGNVLLADRDNQRVRRVTPSGGTRPAAAGSRSAGAR